MTLQRARPARLVRRLSNGDLVDTVEGGPVTLDFVVDLLCLGEHVSIFDEASRDDRTEAVLAPAVFARLRRGGGSPSSVEGVVLARAIKALGDVRSELERIGARIAGLERLLRAAVLRGRRFRRSERRDGCSVSDGTSKRSPRREGKGRPVNEQSSAETPADPPQQTVRSQPPPQMDLNRSDDALFDAMYPEAIRLVSRRFWTPIAVAQRAAELLRGAGARRILDVGAGLGKFVLAAARAAPELDFVGVEQRAPRGSGENRPNEIASKPANGRRGGTGKISTRDRRRLTSRRGGFDSFAAHT